MSDLTALSLKLKDPKLGKEKNNYLFRELKRLNHVIESEVRQEAHRVSLPETRARFKGGIVFPMRIGDDRDPFVILGNIPELSAVFETKARAPFKIVFEVCRLSELIEETKMEEQKAQAEAAGASVTDKVLENEEKKGEETSEVDKEQK